MGQIYPLMQPQMSGARAAQKLPESANGQAQTGYGVDMTADEEQVFEAMREHFKLNTVAEVIEKLCEPYLADINQAMRRAMPLRVVKGGKP